MLVVCEECGIEFDKEPAQAKRTAHNFCCRSCSAKYNNKRRKGPYGGEKRKKLYKKARELRKQNYGYRTIASKIGMHIGTVRNWTCDIPVNIERARRKASEENLSPFEELTSKEAVKRRIIKERGYRCERCGLEEWFNEPIMLEMHHKDGDKENNERENLLLLCLNCHAQTDNYRNKSRD